MSEKKTLEERYADDILTDNAALDKYRQCKTCMFRSKVMVDETEYGYDKCICQIYSGNDVKPYEIMMNEQKCEFYEKEKD